MYKIMTTAVLYNLDAAAGASSVPAAIGNNNGMDISAANIYAVSGVVIRKMFELKQSGEAAAI